MSLLLLGKVWETRGHKCAGKQLSEEEERDQGLEQVRQRSLLENELGVWFNGREFEI